MSRTTLRQAAQQEPVAQYSDIVSDGGMDPRRKFDHSPERETEPSPSAWQWLNTATFRKKLPANAEPGAWNPLYTHPPYRYREWQELTEKEIKSCLRIPAGKDELTRLEFAPNHIYNTEFEMSKNWIAEKADIMERFEWDRVHKVMTALDWTWWWTKTIPTVEEMKATAMQMIDAVIRLYEKEGESTLCSTGGFVARIHKFKNSEPQLSLHFEVTETRGIT